MQRLGFGFALTLALSAPLAANAASCDAPGTCELHYAGGRWAHVPNGRAIDLRQTTGSDAASPIVIDGSRARSDAVIDGTNPAPVNRVVEAVMWNRTSDGRDEVWTRAPRAPSVAR